MKTFCLFLLLAVGTSASILDNELRALTEALFAADVNNVGNQIKVDHQGQCTSGDEAPGPYFTDVPQSALRGITFLALRQLQDNYFPDVTVPEVQEPIEEKEITAFLDVVMATEVMAIAESFIIEKELYTGSLRDKIKEIWFDLYVRKPGTTLGSSGFEHVFVGEIQNKAVSGLHNWVQFYAEEADGNLNYGGYSKFKNLGEKGEILEDHFVWLDYTKTKSSMFVGTSPELELAVYTVCFLARPGPSPLKPSCPVQMNGLQFHINTYPMIYHGKVFVSSAFPVLFSKLNSTSKGNLVFGYS